MLKQIKKKSLGPSLCIFGGMATAPHKRVKRIPVEITQLGERFLIAGAWLCAESSTMFHRVVRNRSAPSGPDYVRTAKIGSCCNSGSKNLLISLETTTLNHEKSARSPLEGRLHVEGVL
jgi:hypothetical protein